MDKQHILDEIRRTAAENDGVVPGKQRFLAETGIRESDWIGRYWVNWSAAVREAGLQPNSKQGRYDSDWLLENLAGLTRDLGHFPLVAELKMRARQEASFPSHNTFRRFGRKAQLAAALLKWCQKNEGWQDVEAACAEAGALESEYEAPESAPDVGYVYLLKSGRFHKIGRSKSPGRREYEIALQLPEPVTRVHTIKTDDPVGIERYWHQRFADRRKNGEWFELRAEDVAAFRRRKFM